MCDGSGACALYPAETVCAAPVCEDGNVRGESLCNGTGSCDAGTLTTCVGGCSEVSAVRAN